MSIKNQLIIVSILLFFLGGCKEQPDLSTINNLNNNTISSFGHGGMGIGHKFPFNSIESIKKCLSYQPTGVEIDLQLSKDNVFVAFHDKTLQEMTNLTGEIYQEDWSYIKDATFADPLLAEYKIASFSEIINSISNPKDYIYTLNTQIYVDSITEEYADNYIDKLLEIIDEFDLSEHVHIEFTNRMMLEKIKTLRPELKLFILGSSDYAVGLAKELNLYGVVASNNNVTKERIQEIHDEGIRVALFSLNTKARNLDAISKHPDILQTDKVRYLVDLLDKD